MTATPSRLRRPESADQGSRAARTCRVVWAYILRAPGTFVWLLILLGTTALMRTMEPELLTHFLRQRSTNLHELSRDPIRVLFLSAMYIDGSYWLPYLVLYNLFHVPAERWLGTRRWLAVAAIAHVGATYVSEGVLYWAIKHHHAPASAVNTLDVGVSYALAGVQGVLTYRIASPWRYVYLVGLLGIYGTILLVSRTFTDVGHFTSVLLGLACYPLVLGRPGRRGWDPVTAYRSVRARCRGLGHRNRPRSTTA
jgi:hypothetical protein